MFRLRASTLLPLLAAAVAFTGCRHVIYRDVYSNKRNYFVPPQEKAVDLPGDKKHEGTGIGTPHVNPVIDPGASPTSLPPVPPSSSPTAPGIPGLDPVPPMGTTM